MAIKLITAQPGSYKTAMMMQLAQDLANSGRPVYLCNIRGLKPAIPFPYQTIEHFKDWVETPETSVIFIDEVQEFTRDVPTNAKTEDLPKWMTLLEKHRHEGKDIYIVTQHPMFIHTHVRRLTSEHTHLVRNGNVPFAVKRVWGHVESDPDDMQKASIKNGCTSSIFKPKKEVFDWYESTVLDTHKFKIPPKLVKGLLMVGGLIAFSVYIGLPTAQKYLNSGDKSLTEVKADTRPATDPSADDVIKKSNGSIDCDVYQNLHLDVCQSLQKSKNEQLQADVKQSISYNPNSPYNDLSKSLTYQVTAQPIFSGCIKYNGKYYAYSQQGTKLNVSSDDCKRLIDDGERPFNYFASYDRSEMSSTDTLPNVSTQTVQPKI